jgi:hypothetical protein
MISRVSGGEKNRSCRKRAIAPVKTQVRRRLSGKENLTKKPETQVQANR